MESHVLGRTALTFVVFLLSLGFVTWRQGRAFEVNRTLDDLRRQVSVAQAERVELTREIQVLESRAHIVPAAEAIGMFTPPAEDQVIIAQGVAR